MAVLPASPAESTMSDLGGNVDPVGRFCRGVFRTSNNYDLATYSWFPACGVSEASGCVFLLHGIFSHARFEFLDPNDQNFRVVYEQSVPHRLNQLGLIVFGHDHPAHGLSSGIRGYWDSMDDLRDAAMEYVNDILANKEYVLKEKPRFVAGMSMGGTVAIEIARIEPDLFSGFALFSPAVRAPDDMFGLYGRLLSSVSSAFNFVAPRLRVISLPPSHEEKIRQAVEQDDLTQKDPMRVRVGAEFLRVYREIQDVAGAIQFPALVVFVGATDPIVSPAGMKEFVDQVSSADKSVHVCENLGHEVLREEGNEDVREALYEWIAARL